MSYSQSEDSGFLAEGARQHGLVVFALPSARLREPAQPVPLPPQHRDQRTVGSQRQLTWLQAVTGCTAEDSVAFVGRVRLHIFQINNLLVTGLSQVVMSNICYWVSSNKPVINW